MTEIHTDRRGSVWRRWDPHLHTPGTVLNNEYRGDDPWEDFLREVEQSEPRIEALGITDYASLDRYEDVLKHQASGRLPEVSLVFANVELRYETATVGGKPINVHLLISPEDEGHVLSARTFLQSLTFSFQGNEYRCDRESLIQLGRDHLGQPALDETAALKAGTNQFKVTRRGLEKALGKSKWASEHVIIGVSGTSGDGTAGLSPDAGLSATRKEIERLSRVIFASQPNQREFWLGHGVVDRDELERTYQGRKVCLHGSDAHCAEKVGKPELDRFTWIKGDLTFESLRQACIEPELRAIVDSKPPDGPVPSRTIEAIEIGEADWFGNGRLAINAGLVGIIGARGSGKTALADLIAAAGYVDVTANEKSFLDRARHLVRGTTVRLHWLEGGTTEHVLGEPLPSETPPLVRYLSQQFVERLCSSEGLTDELLAEIERVVFDAHAEDDRGGALNFRDLLSIRTSRSQAKRRQHEQSISDAGQRIEEERVKHALIGQRRAARDVIAERIRTNKATRVTLQAGATCGDTKRLQSVTAAIDLADTKLAALQRRQRALTLLADTIEAIQEREFPDRLDQLKQRHVGAQLTPDDWEQFQPVFAGDPAAVIEREATTCAEQIGHLLGPPVAANGQTDQPLVAADAALQDVQLLRLRAEAARLKQLAGLDQARVDQLKVIDAQIRADERALGVCEASLAEATGARARIKALLATRDTDYAAIFEAIQDEQDQLDRLYAPVGEVLAGEEGALGKLEFFVRRTVDAEGWAAEGEALLDLRTSGAFRGTGSLLAAIRTEQLDEAWRTGSGTDVATAVAEFRLKHDETIRAHRPAECADPKAHRAWAARVSAWLTSTEHIKLAYGIKFDGVDIEQLSPGTRGIVLLLLYLSLDLNDDRPLIIDQPEENLDPKSIFDELVGRFRAARLRRQVIIVTHNANLIVNTDADQVVAAIDAPHRPGKLPTLQYDAGGLENETIRRKVCDILEGGKPAFRERARRLRVELK